MAETLQLTSTLERSLPDVTAYSVWALALERGPGRVTITIEDNNGHRTTHQYVDEAGSTVATNMIKALNRANLSTVSLERRILERLVADGKIPSGSVVGTPD